MIINKLAWHNIKFNKKQNKIVFVALILTSILLFSLGIGISIVVENGNKVILEQSGSYHVAFMDDASILEKLEKNKDIEEILIASEVKQIPIEYEEYELDYGGTPSLSIIGYSRDYTDELSLINGDYPTNNQELVISDRISRRLNLNVDDFYEGYKIVGVYESSKILYERMNDYYAYTYDVLNKEGEIIYFITFNSLNHAYAKIYNLADELGYKYTINSYWTEERVYENIQINEALLNINGQYADGKKQESEFYLLLIILGVLSLFCISIIYNSIMISIQNRKKELGILRSVGATKGQVFRLVLTETMGIAFFSMLLAFIISIILVKLVILIITLIMGSFLTTKILFIFDWSYVLVSFLFILGVSLIASMIPAFKASVTSPIESIKTTEELKINKGKENYPFIRRRFGYIGEYAYKNIRRQKSKFRTIIFSLSCCIILFMVLSIFFRTNLEDYSDNDWYQFDAQIRIPSTTENVKTYVNEFRKLSGYDEFVWYIDDILPVNLVGNETDEYIEAMKIQEERWKKQAEEWGETYIEDKHEFISIFALDNDSFKKYQKEMKAEGYDYLLFNSSQTSLIKGDFANSAIYRFIDDFTIDIYAVNSNLNEEGTKIGTIDKFKMINKEFYLRPGGIVLVMNMDKYEKIINDVLLTGVDINNYDHQIGMNAKDIYKLDAEINNVLNMYPNVAIYYNPHKIDTQAAHLGNIAYFFVIYTIIIFVAIVCIVNSFNVINANMKVRATEFSVLRSIGLDEDGLVRITNLESYFIHTFTLVFGMTGGVIGVTIEILLGDNFFSGHFVSPLPEIIISIVVMQIVIRSIMRYCNKKIKEQNIIETIRNDSI